MNTENWKKIAEKMACHLAEIDSTLTEKMHDKEFLKVNSTETISQIAEMAASASTGLLHFKKRNNKSKKKFKKELRNSIKKLGNYGGGDFKMCVKCEKIK